MEPRSAALALFVLAALPPHGLAPPTGLGDLARAQERRRCPLPDDVAGSSPVQCAAQRADLRLCWVHGVRFTATIPGDSLSVARERSTEAISGAFGTARGWVFLTASGRALVSDTFLGPMRAVALPACGHRAPRFGLGRAVQFVGDVPYEIDPGRGRVPLHAPARVDELLFCDARSGAAIDRDGALFRTRDGGAHWQPVSLQASPGRRDVAHSLDCADGVRVRLTRGWARFDDDPRDALVPAAGPPRVEPRADDARVLRERFDELAVTPAPLCDDPEPEAPWDPPRARFSLRHRGEPVRSPLFRGSDVLALQPPDGACAGISPPAVGPMVARLRWRGRDARGAFTGAADVLTSIGADGAQEFAVFASSALSVSRDGALLDTPEGHQRWVQGTRRTELALFEAGLLISSGARLDDGTLLLVGFERGSEETQPDQVGDSRRGRHAFVLGRLGADGAMTSRAWSVHDAEAWIVGPAELAGRLGLAVVDRRNVGRFLPMEGDDAVALGPLPVERPQGSADDDPPIHPPPQVRVCGVSDASAPRLHVFPRMRDPDGDSPPITLAPTIGSSDRFQTSHAVYELRGGALCARTIDAFETGQYDREGSRGPGEPDGAVHLEARGGELDGTLDNGITTIRVRLTASPPPGNRLTWEEE